MNQDDYVAERVENQIAWYDTKSQANQRSYKRFRTIEIAAAATIPLLLGFSELANPLQIVVGALGLVVAIIAGLTSLYQFQERWTEYRGTCEALKQEKFFYLTGVAPYDTAEAFPLFVHRVEGLLSKEHASWAQQQRSTETGDAGA